MAYNIQLSLNSVKDFMVEKGGRVTNHELVKHFKICLMNSEDKELARNKFKHYVNTLSNISQERGEKFLVLKRKYRVGTALQVNEYPSPSPDSQPQFPATQNTFQQSNQSAPVQYQNSSSPGIPPPYRPPPPYRHPPSPAGGPIFSPPHFGNEQMSHEFHNSSPSYQYRSAPQSPSTEGLPELSPYRRSSYQDPQDLGIPPPPPPAIHRSSSSGYLIPNNNNSSMSNSITSAQSSTDVNSYSGTNSYNHRNTHDPVKTKLSFNSTRRSSNESLSLSSNALSNSSLSSISISGESEPPIAPPRKRIECKDVRQSSEESIDNSHDGLLNNNDSMMTISSPAESEIKVSVRETTKKFNRMASESEIIPGRSSGKSKRNSRADRDDEETISINSYGLEGQEWLIAAAKSDFNEILRLLKIHPILASYKFLSNGYTALHWAAKHGRSEVAKLLYGTYELDVNAKTNGGYTPLHLAAINNRHDVFDLLNHYGADLNIRDYSGKKPRQYQAIAASTISHDTQKRLIRRRNSLKEASAGFLRMGSLNVKVRKTTEAINNLISRDVVEARLHRAWGSSDSLPGTEKESKHHMPPPKFGPLKKRKHKKEKENVNSNNNAISSNNASVSSLAVTPPSARSAYNVSSLSLPAIMSQDSDSDSACGFGTDWGGQT